ncbi:MAG: enoyl-CoA hydratase/isomerase family protein [Candidatus Rokubacteria bacterium]|nr:enoyl-CoA hydratase/isomerase family protein [Candidatus Rokubacteria bacterium]
MSTPGAQGPQARRWLRVAVEEAVATVTFDRPPVNAVDLDVIDEFLAMVEAVGHDAAVRAVVLTGVERRFCAGADVAMMRDVSRANHEKVRRWVDVQAGLKAMEKPVIAAINGYAFGGGAELALACDVRFMADDARIGFPEIELGIFPGAGGTQRLPRLVGPARALRLMMEGARLAPAEALAMGLVDRVLPAAALAAATRDYARALARKPTRAIGLLKRCAYGGWGRPLADGLAIERAAVFELLETRDAAEGLAAFLARRPPDFTGR